ncbi:hypothetical protein COCSUDRAFT_58424 [Coccomyxa subellipsoidea C-169]|uniref:Uncharacterized protein n=1 Tax=Coccomyxa subellipsoidea (strain C-169) TaxID=574566 RepID=I0YMR9_COCSC|nr:hypothetical protein COCSUDRAFT_58424 [Coccomyxa subellipsoidea C-169]EIE19688.1 hypothetical protein COCSUDRAFT_58424 [Coccomyxa subellipsoidea C-169]|eukprot:XP_005644232.1 hypothetical protein COCSUDRAFT_58424 [Coccomyxa subellipsoidea C-169]
MQNFVSEQFVLYSFQLAFVNAVPAAMPGLHEVLQLDFEGEVIQAENGDLQITLGEVKDRLTGGEDVRVKLKGHVLILNASWPHKKRLPKAKEEDGIEYELVLI